MAPPPEYDKEPKAPDKSATNISTEDSKLVHNLVNDQHINSDYKTSNTVAVEVENNKHVETLDDGQLRALLDEAITYKCPKDREGKSSLFKELLEEVEQDEQACEAAARTLSGCRGARRGGRGRRALPHSNSLQDLVAALAAEPAPRKHHVRHHPPAPAPSNVSARAIHGGSLPSGVDTSSLLSEEPARYLATVRCVNPPPLAERRVSASDANTPAEMELLNRRSKPMFPMTYTARATLEIGSGSVCSGRAVTTTTSSNQVRTTTDSLPTCPYKQIHQNRPLTDHQVALGPRRVARRLPNNLSPENLYSKPNSNQAKLLNALRPKKHVNEDSNVIQHHAQVKEGAAMNVVKEEKSEPHGLIETKIENRIGDQHARNNYFSVEKTLRKERQECSQLWTDNVNNWYKTLSVYTDPFYYENTKKREEGNFYSKEMKVSKPYKNDPTINVGFPNVRTNRDIDSIADISLKTNLKYNIPLNNPTYETIYRNNDTKDFGKQESLHSNNTYYHEKVHKVVEHFEDDLNSESDISLRKTFRKPIDIDLVLPTRSEINPKNFRRMTIGQPRSHFQCVHFENSDNNDKVPEKSMNWQQATSDTKLSKTCDESNLISLNYFKNQSDKVVQDKATTESVQMCNLSFKCLDSSDGENKNITWLTNPCVDIEEKQSIKHDQELIDVPYRRSENKEDSFSQYVANQQKLFESISSLENVKHGVAMSETDESQKEVMFELSNISEHINVNSNVDIDSSKVEERSTSESVEEKEMLIYSKETPGDDKATKSDNMLSNNAYIFLTLPKSLLSPLSSDITFSPVQLLEVEDINDIKPLASETYTKMNNVKKKKEKMSLEYPATSSDKKKALLDKNVLKVLLFESLSKNNISENLSGKLGVSAITDKEVDSAISFSCITTPEVVASCNTTSSTAQSAVAIDPKPLQLGSCYRAVASLVGGEPAGAAGAAGGAAAGAGAGATSPVDLPTVPSVTLRAPAQPRSVISSSFNGLPLSRPNYGSTGNSASDDYKKSLDENGNSVQGFSSPLSGSSQHKKPRRKKSTKNETVIDCQQIDGYQGDKDVNELLRFIESNADNGRAPKLGRVKHKDDSDDKGGKKRSTERRKDKENKMKRATSMEELSRTKIEDLTDGAQPPLRADKKERRGDNAPAKVERRSWGDDARGALLYTEVQPDTTTAAGTVAAAELTDFQTVTKKRKPRRRADEHDREPAPRRARPPSPRPRRESAPPSDRSNDSNDDMDSVHSLPAAPPPAPPAAPAPPPHASYAEIARTRHNIPDLIESCNFYAEGPGGGARRDPAAPAGDADGYPALEVRAAGRRRDGKAAPGGRRERKERPAPPGAPAPPDCPAPDVVADRRPPVILLDSTARPRDMDGVTFGFDINEQLLSGGARRPRCDLVRDAAESGVRVRAGCAALRYVAPDPPPDTAHLLQIVDYVGAAWEDVVRCGGGKVRYYSE